jgi:AraC-like DNA-binding protein
MGLMWLAAFERRDDELNRIHVIGPTFTDDFSLNDVEQELKRMKISPSNRSELIKALEQLPVIALNRLLQYGLMLHYCISHEKIGVSDFGYQTSRSDSAPANATAMKNIHGTWMTEQKILQLVREGNLHYRLEMDRLAMMGTTGKMSNGDPIRQTKNEVIIFTALCTRAAIDGGLSPETAYTLSDHYIQSVESAGSFGELVETNNLMRDDFIKRVHKCRTSQNISLPIQQCCEYITLHIEEKLTLNEIAAHIGYTDYYLAKKFKKQMGCTVNAYIRHAKIERSKIMLRDFGLSIQDISSSLGFCSQSYFSETFHKVVGVPPIEYRLKINATGA